MQLAEYLDEQRVPFEMVLHAPAFTAHRLAYFLNVRRHRVARAVLLDGPNGYFLAVFPGTHWVDLDSLSAALGGAVRVASNDEAAAVFRDCEWGAVAPFGNLYGVPTVLDVRLRPEMPILLEAGTHFEAVRMSCADFERLAGASRLDFARLGLRR